MRHFVEPPMGAKELASPPASPPRLPASTEAELVLITLITFALVIFASLLPLLCVCWYVRQRRPPPPQGGQTSEIDTTATHLRLRVCGTVAWVGWALFCLGTGPFLGFIVGDIDFTPIAGHPVNYLFATWWGMAIMFLTLRPIDAARIAIVGRFLFGVILLFACACVAFLYEAFFFAHQNKWIRVAASLITVLADAVCLALLAPTMSCACCECSPRCTLSPRRALRRIWFTLRLLYVILAIVWSTALLAVAGREGSARGFGGEGSAAVLEHSGRQSVIIVIAGLVSVALAFTPANRGRVHQCLGSLGKGASAEQHAAAVAGLISGGKGGVAAAMQTARDQFVVLPLESLSAADLSTDNKDLAKGSDLSSRVRPAALGECDAFMSHSWRDDGALKYAKLQQHNWRTAAPTIWFDKVRSASLIHSSSACAHATGCTPPRAQACIDQNNIDASLAVLPIFLAGCKTLLVLPGSTYATRLWCAPHNHPLPATHRLIPRVRLRTSSDGDLHIRADGGDPCHQRTH